MKNDFPNDAASRNLSRAVDAEMVIAEVMRKQQETLVAAENQLLRKKLAVFFVGILIACGGVIAITQDTNYTVACGVVAVCLGMMLSDASKHIRK